MIIKIQKKEKGMLSVSERLRSITHPLIASMYMKKDFSDQKNVLVIETAFSINDKEETFDSYLIDLLMDLEDLKNKAENCVGTFDRIDIRPQ